MQSGDVAESAVPVEPDYLRESVPGVSASVSY